jgi:hypothetical protein
MMLVLIRLRNVTFMITPVICWTMPPVSGTLEAQQTFRYLTVLMSPSNSLSRLVFAASSYFPPLSVARVRRKAYEWRLEMIRSHHQRLIGILLWNVRGETKKNDEEPPSRQLVYRQKLKLNTARNPLPTAKLTSWIGCHYADRSLIIFDLKFSRWWFLTCDTVHFGTSLPKIRKNALLWPSKKN